MTNVNSAPRDFRAEINGLRAVSVAAVLLYHFKFPIVTGGFSGVDCFFVISGYLMTRIIDGKLSKEQFSFTEFYLARFVRIVPALAALIGFLLISGAFYMDPAEYQSLGSAASSAISFISDWRFALTSNYFNPNSENNWLLHTWSLSVEWQFYIIYPVLYYFLRFRQALWEIRALILAGIAALSLALNVILVAKGGPWATLGFFVMPARMFEMLAGGLAFHLQCSHASGLQPGQRLCLELLGAALIAVAVIAFDRNSAWPSLSALVPTIGSALIILAARGRNSLLAAMPFQALGRWSYSIYLWHWPLAVYVGTRGHALTWMTTAGLLLLSVIIGFASYRWIEQPALHFLGKREARLWRIAPLVASSFLLLLAGLTVALQQGLPARGNAPEAAMRDAMAASDDWAFPRECTSVLRGLKLACATQAASQAPDVIVVGDSHAQMLFPYFRTRSQNTVFVTSAGCVPMPDVERLDKTFRCSHHHEQVLDYLKTSSARTIIYASIWTPYFGYLSEGERGLACLITIKGCEAINSRETMERAFEGWYREVRRLVEGGWKVAVMLPVPVPHKDIPKLLREDLFWKGTSELHPVLLDRRPQIEEPVRAALKRTTELGVTIIDPRDAMCNAGRCPVLGKDGRSLYKDGNHIRPYALQPLGEMFAPFLQSSRMSVSDGSNRAPL